MAFDHQEPIRFGSIDPDELLYTHGKVDELVQGAESRAKQYVDEKTSSVYKFMGSVPTYSDLPSSGNVSGHVYDVADTGDNYAWVDGTGGSAGHWDKLGPNMSGYVPSTRTVNGKALSVDVEITADDVPDGGSSVKARLDGIDDALAGKVSKSGDIMTGALMFDRQGAATAQFTTYDEDTGESPTLTLVFGCDPLSGESGAVTASGEFAVPGYDSATGETHWRRFRLAANARFDADSPGYGYVEADILDATGVVVSENYYAWLSIYDYGDDYGYVEATMDVSFYADGTQYETSLNGELTSRTPSLSGRAVTTPELEAVKSTAEDARSAASSAQSAANSKATMTQVNNAIATHNSSATAHSSAISSAVSTALSPAIDAHKNAFDAHQMSINGVYNAQGGYYTFTAPDGTVVPSFYRKDTFHEMFVKETTDSEAYLAHGGNFVLFANVGDDRFDSATSRRTYHATVYIADYRTDQTISYNENPIKTIWVSIGERKKKLFDASGARSFYTSVVAVSMDIVFLGFRNNGTTDGVHEVTGVKATNIRVWTCDKTVGYSVHTQEKTNVRDAPLFQALLEDDAENGTAVARLTFPGVWVVLATNTPPVLDLSEIQRGETVTAYVRRGGSSSTAPASTFDSIRIKYSESAYSNVAIGALLPDATYGTYRDWWKLTIQKAWANSDNVSVSVEKGVGRMSLSNPTGVFVSYNPSSADVSRVVAALPDAQAKFDDAVAGTSSLADVCDMVVAMYRSMGFSPTPADSNA